ncbi:MAG: hypothetical protein ACYDD0_02720 [Candidatus Dormibacteria bacterium]
MVEDPLRHVESFVAAGAIILTLHVEGTRHPHRVLQALRGSGVVRGGGEQLLVRRAIVGAAELEGVVATAQNLRDWPDIASQSGVVDAAAPPTSATATARTLDHPAPWEVA